jgi:hypothetical protein
LIFQQCEILGYYGRGYEEYVFLDVMPFSLVFDGGRVMVAAGTLFVAGMPNLQDPAFYTGKITRPLSQSSATDLLCVSM